MNLKLSPVTNLSDARYAAAAGFHYIGFCLNPSSADFIAPIMAKEIIEWTSGCHAVGEFGDQSAEEIAEISSLLNLDVVLVNNTLLPDELPGIGFPVIKGINLNQFNQEQTEAELKAYAHVCDGFELFTSTPETLNLSWIATLAKDYQLLINFGNMPQLKNWAETINPHAICLHAGKEEVVGMRDFEDLDKLLDQLK